MDIMYLTGAAFRVWGEAGSKRRFIQFLHPQLATPTTLLLEESEIAQICEALQQQLPSGAYSLPNTIQ